MLIVQQYALLILAASLGAVFGWRLRDALMNARADDVKAERDAAHKLAQRISGLSGRN